MRISLCVPMYNESSIIANTAKELHKYMTEHFGEDYEIIFADDGRKDNSADIVNNLNLPNIKVVRYPQNQGKGCAVRHGVLASCGDIVIFTDADLAYGVDVISDMFERFTTECADADLMIGSRVIDPKGYEGYTFMRRLASKVYLKLLTVYAGFSHSDSQCGIKMFRGEAARTIFSYCEIDKWAFDFEALLIAKKLGMKVAEHPVHIINHRESTVRVLRDSVKMLRDVHRMKKRIKKQEIQ